MISKLSIRASLKVDEKALEGKRLACRKTLRSAAIVGKHSHFTVIGDPLTTQIKGLVQFLMVG